MRSLFVGVPDETFERLKQLAEQERRLPRDQASVLLERAIKRAAVPRTPRLQPEVTHGAQ